MDEFDVHNRKRAYERAIAKLKNSNLSEKNKQLILKFHEECFSNGLRICITPHFNAPEACR